MLRHQALHTNALAPMSLSRQPLGTSAAISTAVRGSAAMQCTSMLSSLELLLSHPPSSRGTDWGKFTPEGGRPGTLQPIAQP